MNILKNLSTFAVPLAGASVVLLSSCGTFKGAGQPISDTGFNPLDKPGTSLIRVGSSRGNQVGGLVNSNDHGFNNGDIVEVVIPNTALFDKVPKAGDRYKKVLNVGDSLRVVGGEKDFIQVITEDNETGYVSSVMVVTQGFLTGGGPIDPSVTTVGADELPIIPDIAPDPVVQGIGVPDQAPGVAPVPVPNITSPIPIDPDPGLTVPDIPTPAPVIPDPQPVVPSIPDAPAPEPKNQGITE